MLWRKRELWVICAVKHEMVTHLDFTDLIGNKLPPRQPATKGEFNVDYGLL